MVNQDDFDPRDAWYGVSVIGGRLQDKDVMVSSFRLTIRKG